MTKLEAKIYETFKTEVDLIADVEDVTPDVAVDMFKSNVERDGKYRYVDNAKAKAKLDEIRAELAE